MLIQQHNWDHNQAGTYDEAWSQMFHPLHGYCHTFNMKVASKKLLNPHALKHIDIFLNRKMFAILHEESYLPDDTDGDASILLSNWKVLNLEEKTITQSNLKRLPCTNDKHLTCAANWFHKKVAEEYGCKVSYLNIGHHMPANVSGLPECTDNSRILKVNPANHKSEKNKKKYIKSLINNR